MAIQTYGMLSDSDNTYQVLDPKVLAEYSDDHGTPNDFWMRANSYECPRGYPYGTAWLLMRRDDVVKMQANDEKFKTLRWFHHDDTVTTGTYPPAHVTAGTAEAGKELHVDNLQFIEAHAMVRHNVDAAATYLVELRDVRHFFDRMVCTNSRYNISGVSATKNGDVDWTWQTMLDNLWEMLPATYRGTNPTLPYTPKGTPSYKFKSISPWRAIHQVLWDIGCTTAFDPTAASDPFTYIQYGDTQANLSTSESTLKTDGKLTYDYDSLGANASRIPETIYVVFVDDAGSWVEEVAWDTNDANAIADTSVCIIAHMDNTASNLTDIATERATNWLNKLLTTDAKQQRWYIGPHTTILPGSEVRSVTWRSFGNFEGTITEISKGPDQAPPREDTDSDTVDYVVRFEITDASIGSATCLVRSTPPGIEEDQLPGHDGTHIEVCDPSQCFFNEPVGELLGRQGWARWMNPLFVNVCQPETYDLEPHWEVFSLCCPSQSCA